MQTQFVDEFFVREVNRGKPRLSITVAVFMGWRVSVFSFECGGRTYAFAPRGAVVAGDSARSRFELRVCSRSSTDAVGNDADRLEFRYRDANNRMDLKCSRTSVPGTWLTVSHISGPTLIRTITSVRENKARVEGPEQTEQFAQLAAVHEGWWRSSVAQTEDAVGCLVVFVEGLEEGNFHVQARARGNRSFARSTAGLTPGIFAEEMSRRSCNITTAVIEEVEVVEEIGTAHSTAAQKESTQSSAAAQGPKSYGPPMVE